jgi:hypothetical protein
MRFRQLTHNANLARSSRARAPLARTQVTQTHRGAPEARAEASIYAVRVLENIQRDANPGMNGIVHIISTVHVHHVHRIAVGPSRRPRIDEPKPVPSIAEEVVIVIASANVKPVLSAEAGPVMRVGNTPVRAPRWPGVRVLLVIHRMLLRARGLLLRMGRAVLSRMSGVLRMARSLLAVFLGLCALLLRLASLMTAFLMIALLMIVLSCGNGSGCSEKQNQRGCGDCKLHVYHLESRDSRGTGHGGRATAL